MIDAGNEPTELSPWWRHATILVVIAGFSVLSGITVLTYTNAPPIPGRVVDAAGATVFDNQTIRWPVTGPAVPRIYGAR